MVCLQIGHKSNVNPDNIKIACYFSMATASKYKIIERLKIFYIFVKNI